MPSMRQANGSVQMRANDSAQETGKSRLSMLCVQREGGSMGRPGIEHTMVVERITHSVDGDACDVCGSHRDVAQVICVMESPTGEAGGLANMVFVCASCASYIIQVTTGFRAVKTLESWRYVRRTHARYRGDKTLVDPESGEPVG